jgi:hypothetical protein
MLKLQTPKSIFFITIGIIFLIFSGLKFSHVAFFDIPFLSPYIPMGAGVLFGYLSFNYVEMIDGSKAQAIKGKHPEKFAFVNRLKSIQKILVTTAFIIFIFCIFIDGINLIKVAALFLASILSFLSYFILIYVAVLQNSLFRRNST